MNEDDKKEWEAKEWEDKYWFWVILAMVGFALLLKASPILRHLVFG